jgi:hypothetical protein
MPEPDALIESSELRGYLASKGWRREGDWRGAGVWELESSGRLLIPDHREYQDDGELLSEAVRKLAGYERRPEQELLLDISDPMVDSLYFRTFPQTPSGTTPLPSGLKAVQGIHDLMATAARTFEEGPQMLFERRRSRRVDRFLHTITLGSARPGSYVLTARVPVRVPQQESPQSELWLTSGTPQRRGALPGRDVVSEFHQATLTAYAAAARVAGGNDRLDVFDEGVERGISANLCRALADLGGHAKDRPFEIGFSWARGLPGQEPSEPIAFTGSMASVLSRAAEDLERMAKSGRAQITGHVETLNISPGEEPKIKIVGEFHSESGEPVQRSLWVIVSRDDYDRAIEAQRAGYSLEVEGRLVTVSRRRRELRPSRFDIHRR